MDVTVVTLFGLTWLMLRDEFGFGKTRMLRAMRHLQILVKALLDDRFKLDEIRTELKKEIGVDITDRSVFVPDEGGDNAKQV